MTHCHIMSYPIYGPYGYPVIPQALQNSQKRLVILPILGASSTLGSSALCKIFTDSSVRAFPRRSKDRLRVHRRRKKNEINYQSNQDRIYIYIYWKYIGRMFEADWNYIDPRWKSHETIFILILCIEIRGLRHNLSDAK